MIEVEIKIPASEENIARLTDGAVFLKEVVNKDTYYDTSEYKLTFQGIWFRDRNGSFELKIPVSDQTSGVNTYLEYETDEEIRYHLGIGEGSSLMSDLGNLGYIPWINFVNTRRSYEHSGFRIDIDNLDYGFSMIEIEKLVEEGADLTSVERDIRAFLESKEIDHNQISPGKAAGYLKKYNPALLEQLVERGIITKY